MQLSMPLISSVLVQIRDRMAAAGLPLSDDVCTSLLIACGKAGQLEAAFSLWSELQQQGATKHAESVIAVSLSHCSHKALPLLDGGHLACPVLPLQLRLLPLTSAVGPLLHLFYVRLQC